jgi:hypothetical protein
MLLTMQETLRMHIASIQSAILWWSIFPAIYLIANVRRGEESENKRGSD